MITTANVATVLPPGVKSIQLDNLRLMNIKKEENKAKPKTKAV